MIRIAIVGMGLIGTSLGMALRSVDEKEAPLGKIEVVGYDSDQRAVKEARGRLAIDREARSLAEAARDAQVLVIATPVQAIEGILSQLATLLPAGSVVTDVASTKGQVVAWAGRLLPAGIDFVGGHPMAGKEQSGPAAGDPHLFKNAIYCLTPTHSASAEAIAVVSSMVEQVGAKPYFIDPAEHDAYVAGISHLPFLLSTVLVDVVGGGPAWKEMAPLAATGFRDVSRLASGDPDMYRDICMTNHTAINRWINEIINRLLDVRTAMEQADAEQLRALFAGARERREEWLNNRPNMRPGEADFQDPGRVERPNLFGFRSSGEHKKT